MDCDYPHIIKGRIVKEKRTTSEEHRSAEGRKFWIITESDRSATTILLPEDY